jgi:hypothetical protein
VCPNYWCLADPNAFFPRTFGEELDIDRHAWFADIRRKAPTVEFLVPLKAKPQIERNGWLSGHKVWYLESLGPMVSLDYADSNIDKPIPWGLGTIEAIAIPAAIYMGFKEIYLLGCDANWWVKSLLDGNLDMEYEHFYTEQPFASREGTLRDFGLEVELRNLSNHFKIFRLWREYAESIGVRILNATKGGILDVFPRVQYEAIVQKRERIH